MKIKVSSKYAHTYTAVRKTFISGKNDNPGTYLNIVVGRTLLHLFGSLI